MSKPKRQTTLEIAQGLCEVGAISEARLKGNAEAVTVDRDPPITTDIAVPQGGCRAQNDRPCYACETGTTRPTSLLGREFNYRGLRLRFDEDIVVRVCDTCGEMILGGERPRLAAARLQRLWRESAEAELKNGP